MDLRKLAEPFPPSDVEWRLQQAGEKNNRVWARCLAYITNRAIMQRLDDVCGPGNWRNEYRYETGGAVLCGLSVRIGAPQSMGDIGGGEWVTKWDGAENTDIEAVKGGLSGAMKRAAVQWGIGRYLYELEEGFANVNDNGANYVSAKPGKHPAFKWDPPTLPAWALPGGSGKPGVKAEKAAAEKSTTGSRRASQSEDVGTQPPNAPSAAPAPRASRTKADAVAAEDREYDGKRLGDYTEGELAALAMKAREKKANDWVKWISEVRTNRLLGTGPKREPTADEAVQKMTEAVEAEHAALPFK